MRGWSIDQPLFSYFIRQRYKVWPFLLWSTILWRCHSSSGSALNIDMEKVKGDKKFNFKMHLFFREGKHIRRLSV